MTAIRTAGLRSRTLVFAAFVACAFLGVLVRLSYLQVVKHDEYSRLAESQHAKTIAIRPKRGPIVDRTGQVRKIHAGFYGPATGAHYELLVGEWTALLESLLAEPDVTP